MTVCVNDLQAWGWKMHGREVQSCHMFCDQVDLSELHALAQNGGSVESFWARVDAGQAPKGVIATRMCEASSRDIYQRNLILMDWRLAPEIDKAAMALTAGKPCWDEVEHHSAHPPTTAGRASATSPQAPERPV